MKFSTILIIGLIILISLTPYSRASVLENEHYIICGYVYEPWTYDTILIENVRTGEVLEITLQQFEPDKKEYQVTIANFPSGWIWSDTITVTYDNKTISTKLTKGDVGNQVDFNRPFGIDPIAVITGTVLIISSSGLYYRIKRRKFNMIEKNTETSEPPETKEPQPRSLIDMVFGGTKKAFITISTLGMIAAFATGGDVPNEAWVLYGTIIGNYFGVGGVKLGMNKQ